MDYIEKMIEKMSEMMTNELVAVSQDYDSSNETATKQFFNFFQEYYSIVK